MSQTVAVLAEKKVINALRILKCVSAKEFPADHVNVQGSAQTVAFAALNQIGYVAFEKIHTGEQKQFIQILKMPVQGSAVQIGFLGDLSNRYRF
ncbi:hypothetical protein [Oscillibacter sp.]|uniref:hypothetical protein n=1 Tax=Oscillibacter sp. TaxID=1945593 RepID=UPI00289D009A|nr:hypothetical protein [Oscillibacter sp.]